MKPKEPTAIMSSSSLERRRASPWPETLTPPDGVSAGASIPFATASLHTMHSELLALVGGDADGPVLFTVVEQPRPGLLVRATGLLSIDAGSGNYVFTEAGEPPASVFVTPSEERMLDHIVALLSTQATSLTPRTLWGAIDILVGQTLGQVERSMILATFRHCAGDLRRAASVLGVPVGELAGKLKVIRRGDAIWGAQST